MFHLGNTERAKRVARDLKKLMNDAGHPITLSEAQEVTSRMLWYRNWQDLVRNHAAADPSKDDSSVPPHLVDSRRQHHISVLVGAGVDVTKAADLVQALAPTDRSAATPPKEIDLDSLGISNLERWKRALTRNTGLCIVCGPNRSGITTTLSGTVAHLRQAGISVHTVTISSTETMAVGFEQSGHIHEGGDKQAFVLSYEPGPKTLKQMIDIASGRLVVLPMQATSVAHALRRLLAMGLDREELRYVMRGILAQQLVRTLDVSRPRSTEGPYRGVQLASECYLVSSDDNLFLNGRMENHLIRPDQRILDDAQRIFHAGQTDEAEIYRLFGVEMTAA